MGIVINQICDSQSRNTSIVLIMSLSFLMRGLVQEGSVPWSKAALACGSQSSNLASWNSKVTCNQEFLDWVAAVKEVLDFNEVPDDQRIPLMETKFRGRASAWWQQLK